ncbi:hypothetical protein EDD11_001992 [Mortierella claussenii]|nr:hypothetical protein EDD11_001992 [Mortierella claussenii]
MSQRNYADREAFYRMLSYKTAWLRRLHFHGHLTPAQFLVLVNPQCCHIQSLLLTGPMPDKDKGADVEPESSTEGRQEMPQYTNAYRQRCKQLLKQNRGTLKELLVQGFLSPPWKAAGRGKSFWSPILSCVYHEQLRTLQLLECTIRGRHLKAFWKICERLERLDMDAVQLDVSHLPASVMQRDFKTMKKIPRGSSSIIVNGQRVDAGSVSATAVAVQPQKRFPRLRELFLSTITFTRPTRLLKFIVAECPRLQTLYWNHTVSDYTSYGFPEQPFCDYLREGTWPELERLTIMKPSPLNHSALEQIVVGACRPFKKLNLEISLITQGTYYTMKARHFADLQEIDISRIWDHRHGWLVRELLCHCPQLEILRADYATAEQMIKINRESHPQQEPQPWVCFNLRELRVQVDMGIVGYIAPRRFTLQEQERSRAVFTQLAQLKQLRVLDLSSRDRFRRGSYQQVPLPFQLHMGLELLEGLTRLEKISYSGEQCMAKKDVVWITNHLTQLRVFHGEGGRLNSKRDVSVAKEKYVWDFELSKILNKSGMATPGSVYDKGYLDKEKYVMGDGWPALDEDEEDYQEEDMADLIADSSLVPSFDCLWSLAS